MNTETTCFSKISFVSRRETIYERELFREKLLKIVIIEK